MTHEKDRGGAVPAETEALLRRIRELEAELGERDRKDALVDACLSAAGARLFVQDHDLRYTWLRNPVEGFVEADVIGLTDADFFPPEDAVRLAGVKRGVLETGLPAHEEVKVRLSGRPMVFDVVASPLRDEARKITGIAGAGWDVTESRRMREAHLANEERLRHLTDLAFEGIAIHRGGDLLFVNKTFADLFGRDRADLIGGNLLDLLAPESGETARERIQAADMTPYEVWIVRPDGERRFCEVSGRAVDYYGEMARFVSFRDVTTCRRAEADLRESEETLRTLFDSVPDSVFLKDKDLRFRKINRAMERVFGRKEAEIAGLTTHEVFQKNGGGPATAEEADTVEDSDRRVLAGETVTQNITGMVGEDLHFFHIVKAPIRNEAGDVAGICGISHDVTEEREANRILRETQERLSLALRGDRIGIWDWHLDTGEIVYTTVVAPGGDEPIREMRMRVAEWWERIHPEDRREVSLTVRDYLEGRNEVYVVEMRYRYGEGTYRWIRNQGEITERDETGRPIRMTGTHRDITIEKRSEEAILKSESRYRNLVDHSPIPILIHAEEKVVFVNPAAAKALGADPEELIGFSIWDMVAPSSWEVARKRVDQIYREGVEVPLLRVRFRHFDGTEFDADVAGTGIEFEGKRASQIVFLDVSERIRTENALRGSEEKYRLLVENVGAAIIVVDGDGKILFVNDVAAASFGMETDGLMGRRMEELFPPEVAQAQMSDVRAVIESGRELRKRHQSLINGEWRWFDSTVHPYRDARGRVTAALVIATDITDMRRNEEDRVRLSTAVESLGESVMITDPEGTIQYINHAFEMLSGYSREEAVGRHSRILKSGEQDEAFYRDLWGTITRGRVWRGRIVNRRKDGVLYHTDATISPIRDGEGGIINYVAVKRDVTREVEIQARIRQGQKMEAIGTLAGGIAHDFNNLLYAMLGFTEMALDETPGEGKVRVCLEQVREGGRRASDLVRQILAFSRKDDPDLRPLRIQPVIHEALKLLRGSTPPGVTIRERIDEKCMAVRTESTRIHQVVMNLCANSFHAMSGKDGTLTVELRETAVAAGEEGAAGLAPGRYARLTVRDTGRGMSEKTLRRVFEPYFTTKEVGEGTGLGLAAVHGIVHAHGGDIRLESKPGVGTTATVYLPVAGAGGEKKPRVAGKIDETPSHRIEGGRGERILYVDDDEPVCDLGKMMIEGLGYRIEAFTSGKGALERFRVEPGAFDLMITDWVMPEMSGLDLAREVTRIRPDLPVLLCTGKTVDLREGEGAAAGIRRLIKKPVEKKELAGAIREALDSNEKVEVGTGAANTGD
ncbi:MAG: PAS domain S-box protein [Candidatus Eisenbacteria bacterium]|nr:PAS domain S-box protein [Candidatus Eisenbacteria bacterium]